MRGPFAIVLGAALALLIIGVYFSLAPAVGGSIEAAQPTLGPNSSWNATHNTALVGGGTWFGQNQSWVTLLFLGIVAAVVIGMFMRW